MARGRTGSTRRPAVAPGRRAMAVAAGLALAWAGATGCGGSGEATGDAARPPADAVEVVDDAGRRVALPRPAERVVSLVPSVTETIVALDAADRLVARTRYDLDPALADLPSVGGGLDPSVEAIVGLEPDLVVVWNAAGGRLAPRLAEAGVPVYVAEVQDTTDVHATIRRIGALVGRVDAARRLSGDLRDTLAAIAAESAGEARPTVFYWMAGDPPATAGAETFIGQAIGVAGGEPAFAGGDALWPAVSLEAVVALDPDLIVVPTGPGLPPASSLADAAGWRDLGAVREGRIVEIPADLLARPGPRLGEAARALRDGIVAERTARAGEGP